MVWHIKIYSFFLITVFSYMYIVCCLQSTRYGHHGDIGHFATYTVMELPVETGLALLRMYPCALNHPMKPKPATLKLVQVLSYKHHFCPCSSFSRNAIQYDLRRLIYLINIHLHRNLNPKWLI